MKATPLADRRKPADTPIRPAELCRALALEEFELLLQPLVDLRARRVSGCEALLRWHHPARGTLLPRAFLPAAETSGLMPAIGEWALRRACAQTRFWPAELRLVVNLSPVQLASPTLLRSIAEALAESGLPPARLELDITDSFSLHDMGRPHDMGLAMLHRLRDCGARIALDDFGAVPSSLTVLRRFPFDRIKIDPCFLRDLAADPPGAAHTVLGAILRLGHELGMDVTAEGAETPAQLDQLTRHGCPEAQGNLFSRPRTAADIPGVIARLNRRSRAEGAGKALPSSCERRGGWARTEAETTSLPHP